MTKIKLYNTLTRKKEDFKPITAGKVGMYVCGVTPYDYSHIGHARAYVVFDVLYRLMRHEYGADNVNYVRNFTDIDDKIIQRAQEKGEKPTALAQKFIDAYHEDMTALNVLPPTAEPKVSETIPEIITMIKTLVDKGYAYVTASGDVNYDISKFADYGKLANRDLEGQLAGARVGVNDEKRNSGDFVLWKSAKADEPESVKFVSPWGKGRPGWHIECSAMSKKILGDSFDIHGGGEDLKFPHHSCEIAQSEAANFDLVDGKTSNGGKYVNYWLHNGFITVNGTKMSKFLGNFTTIRDVLQEFGGKYSGEALRLWILGTHYRKPLNFSEKSLDEAEKKLLLWAKKFYKAHWVGANIPKDELKNSIEKLTNDFYLALGNDLNISEAFAVIEKTFSLLERASLNQGNNIIRPKFKEFLLVLGFDIGNNTGFIAEAKIRCEQIYAEEEKFIEEICLKVKQHNNAKAAKDFTTADKIRNELATQGIILKDTADGTTWRLK